MLGRFDDAVLAIHEALSTLEHGTHASRGQVALDSGSFATEC